MITKSHRFHGRGSLRHVYQHGKTVRTPEFGLRFMLNDRRRAFRMAVVVSKSISKSAVVRNRIRRRLYEAMRQYALLIDKPYDLVITIYKPEISQLSSADLLATIKELLGQADIIPGATKNDSKTRAIIDGKEN